MMKNSRIQRTTVAILSIGAVAVAASSARADVWHFTSHLNGSQVTPPTSSDATGIAHVDYNDETNLLQIDVFVEGIGLNNDLTAAHIHIGRKGFAGPWNIQLGPVTDWFVDGAGIRRVLTDVPYPEVDEHNLFEDGTFVMLHTVDWPGGEIRGQLIQEPRLTVSSLARGKPAIFQVINALPNERVYYVYSLNGLGDGPSIPALGGMTLDILDKVRLLSALKTDDTGSAILRIVVPSNTPLIDVYWQAGIARGVNGEDSVKSNTVSTVVLP